MEVTGRGLFLSVSCSLVACLWTDRKNRICGSPNLFVRSWYFKQGRVMNNRGYQQWGDLVYGEGRTWRRELEGCDPQLVWALPVRPPDSSSTTMGCGKTPFPGCLPKSRLQVAHFAMSETPGKGCRESYRNSNSCDVLSLTLAAFVTIRQSDPLWQMTPGQLPYEHR